VDKKLIGRNFEGKFGCFPGFDTYERFFLPWSQELTEPNAAFK
jgi:hypothetical protein